MSEQKNMLPLIAGAVNCLAVHAFELHDAIMQDVEERYGVEECNAVLLRMMNGVKAMYEGKLSPLEDEENYWLSIIVATQMFAPRSYQVAWAEEIN